MSLWYCPKCKDLVYNPIPSVCPQCGSTCDYYEGNTQEIKDSQILYIDDNGKTTPIISQEENHYD